MRPIRRLILMFALIAAACLAGGCHTMEGLSYDIEDASAYTGQQIAQTGEDFAEWVRSFNEDD